MSDKQFTLCSSWYAKNNEKKNPNLNAYSDYLTMGYYKTIKNNGTQAG